MMSNARASSSPKFLGKGIIPHQELDGPTGITEDSKVVIWLSTRSIHKATGIIWEVRGVVDLTLGVRHFFG